MNEITYTRLRQNLAHVLNKVRNGEEFIVTQRGKSSVRLSSNDEMIAPSLIKDISNQLKLKTNWKDVFNTKIKPVMNLKHSEMIKTDSDYFNKQKITIEDAVKEVRMRHAKTIKALEDN
ncbi:type II toxin-antitoxin system prevent-host-death family antitoxin [Candidatus Regiella endosymbiont of Tuberolachnus salignus]|uniref:type II toxin-antitoxin system Phd/YefM family antitoxin n=1 Tax=Candidatus Regiella endosymbiont of Tuberolachnus salignus TaxID=3077956 RepID=UPI0030D06A40